MLSYKSIAEYDFEPYPSMRQPVRNNRPCLQRLLFLQLLFVHGQYNCCSIPVQTMHWQSEKQECSVLFLYRDNDQYGISGLL